MKTRFLPHLLVSGVLGLLLGPVAPPLAAQVPPEFTSRGQPMDQSVSLEADVLFSARAVGDEPMQYQWRYEGVPLAEATAPTYTITQVQTEHAGGYDVVVANLHGSITSRVAILTVDPTFTKLREGPMFPMLEDRANFNGAAWGDYDGDGDLDLFVTTCSAENRFYHNLLNETGEAVFSRAPAEASANDPIAGGVGVAWADFDNDGDLDLLVGGWEKARLYENVPGHPLRHLLSVGPDCVESAAWADLDNDGLLDMNLSVWFSACPAGASSSSLFHRNQGEAAFGLVDNPWRDQANAITSTWSDYDGDGDMDLFAANAGWNRLWINQGDGLFRIELESPISQSEAGWAGAWADLDNDGRLDLYLATGAGQSRRNLLYWNEGSAGFTVVTSGPPVDELKDAHGVAIGDYDNDGFLDIYVANKGGSDNSDSLYRNLGGRQFERMTTGSPVNERIDSKTPCWVDFDNDGDLDLFVASGIRGGPALCQNVFYRNNGNDNHWIRIRCVGGQRPGSTPRPSNRDGIGAKVRLEAVFRGETVWQMREITGGPGICYSQPWEAHFALVTPPGSGLCSSNGLRHGPGVERLARRHLNGRRRTSHPVGRALFLRGWRP